MARARYTALRRILLLFMSLMVCMPSSIGEALGQQDMFFERSKASIVTYKGKFDFSVEMALRREQHAQGLQHRKYLPPTDGMFFNFQEDRIVNMWMKNTPISLDMIFIDAKGTIVSIVENTEPFSLLNISSGRIARAVLEVSGGTAQRIGAKAGDRVLHPTFGLS
jgi:uncharacterized membrane protein (UPF0127 family)